MTLILFLVSNVWKNITYKFSCMILINIHVSIFALLFFIYDQSDVKLECYVSLWEIFVRDADPHIYTHFYARMNACFPIDRFCTRILEHNEIVNRYSVAKLSICCTASGRNATRQLLPKPTDRHIRLSKGSFWSMFLYLLLKRVVSIVFPFRSANTNRTCQPSSENFKHTR